MSYPFVPEGATVHTIAQLTGDVKRLLEERYTGVWVEGEISNLSRASSGHIYLSLKEGTTATMKAVLYRGVALRLPAGFEPRDGLEVVCFGRLSVYAPQGSYQFTIEKLHPKGIGAAELALRQLREKLFQLGWFDPKRKRPLPRFPRRIALVTSPTGAAVRDMLEILGRRWPLAQVYLRPVRVQGDGAAEEIAAAIAQLNKWRAARYIAPDVIIVGRGGGSLEDFWPFNAEIVARAIFESRVPVVSAVGHEVDHVLSDDVADVRAPTPTAAAAMVVPDRIEVLDYVRDLGDRSHDAARRRIELAQKRLADLAGRRALRAPMDRLRDLERRLDDWGERLRRTVQQRVARGEQAVAAFAGRLESLSPLNVLARGYSLTRTEASPELIRDAGRVRAGDRLITTVQRGTIVSRVEEVAPSTITDDPTPRSG